MNTILIIIALIGVGLLIFIRARRRAFERYSTVCETIETFRAAAEEELDKMRHDIEVEWAVEQSKYETIH